MLTDPILRSKIDSLWDKLWSGGLSNPMDAIEQFSYLLFLKRMDEADIERERSARRRNRKHTTLFPDEKLRWSYWSQLPAADALKQIKERVFPFLKTLGGDGGSFAAQMENAEFKINKPSLLIEACRAIEEMQVSAQNQDVQGDLYEYLLSKLNTAGTNGQFRTPRHIIRLMVKMLDPRPGERVCDPAAGTCGFLVNAWQHLLETHTDPEILEYDEDGWPHKLIGEKLTQEQLTFAQDRAFTAYDSDSGMTMLRIGSMNLMLHGIERPRFRYADTLSKSFGEERAYDVILANPPFKGAIDASDVHPDLPTGVKKTEILFLHLFLRLLEMGGRAAVIVPDGVLFGSTNAHVSIRKKLIEENRLDGVISMPGGVFKPYAGVSTAILLFSRGGTTEKIWFYDMEHDGFSLDDKRQKIADNDLPDLLECWRHRRDAKFALRRAQRLAELEKKAAPLKVEDLRLQGEVHRLTFEAALAPDDDEKARAGLAEAQRELAALVARLAPVQSEINQLNRQFWVTKDQVKANRYDLSASRYRRVEREPLFLAKPAITLQRLQQLEKVAVADVAGLVKSL
jgi:type I restriction enzyme M protein